jgi:hypothetical protein
MPQNSFLSPSSWFYPGKPEYLKFFAALQQFFVMTRIPHAHSLAASLNFLNLSNPQNNMYLIAIAWMYVVVMMSVAEATAPNGTVLGAIITFFLYGVLPCVILMYLMGTPMRRRAIRAKEQAELEAYRAAAAQQEAAAATTLSPSSFQPNAGSEPAADAIPPMREKL